MRHANSSSVTLQDVACIEPGIHSDPAAHSLKGIAEGSLCPGDSVRRDNAPNTLSNLAGAHLLRTESVWTDIPPSLISPIVRRMRSGLDCAEEAADTSRRRFRVFFGMRRRTWCRGHGEHTDDGSNIRSLRPQRSGRSAPSIPRLGVALISAPIFGPLRRLSWPTSLAVVNRSSTALNLRN